MINRHNPHLGLESINVRSYLPPQFSSKKDICSIPHRDRGDEALADFRELANFIWSVADLLRGPYRPNQFKDVMLPLTVLRRLDCMLEETKFAEINALVRKVATAMEQLQEYRVALNSAAVTGKIELRGEDLV